MCWLCIAQVISFKQIKINHDLCLKEKLYIICYFRGIWIRTRAGRLKRLWKKSQNRKRRLRQHVFCNATQSKLLDKMTTKFWHRRKYYVDDPYEPYHTREEFEITRRKPKYYY